MKKYIKLFPLAAFLLLLITGCTKEEYRFGDITAPTGLTLTTAIAGADPANLNGDGTGNVNITVNAENALSYTFDYGDGVKEAKSSGTLTHKYTTPGTNTYTITVTAVGTGGAVSTISKQVTVFVLFTIPPQILTDLTNDASKVWIIDRDADGHFGVGAGDAFFPNYYAAPPNTREPCAYDDEITFTKTPVGGVTMAVNNMGQSMSIGAATTYYGFGGPDGCFPLTTGFNNLSFMDATSASTPAISTRIQFRVPGKGIIVFGTGGVMYEILSISATSMHLRNIGIDGNSWYQKLKKKP